MDRHSRQSRLAGVGGAGQARIGRTTVDVGLSGFAADVAARYLAGAGVHGVRVRSEDLARGARGIDGQVQVEVDPRLAVMPAEALEVDDPSALELAQGALFALRALRGAAGGRP